MTRGASLIDPLAPISAGRFDRDAARHLLRRAGFGPRPGQVERAVERGLEATLGTLLEPSEHPGTLREDARHLLAAGRIEALQSWWMALILGDHDPLRERMTLAWHDHFATSSDKVDDVRLMHRQNETLRDLALGDFRDLLQATGLSDTRRGFGRLPSFTPPPKLPILSVAIDHILVGAGFDVLERRTELVPGSDHRAALARIALTGSPDL